MILVGQYDSPYVRRVAIALHVFGLPFTRDTRSVFADADAMRTINPLGRIPSLVLDDGEVLIDSAAILDHLDEQVGPARALLPRDGEARRRALRIVALACGAIDKTGAIKYERALRPPDKQHAPWLERCLVQATSAFEALEAITPGAGWYVADRPMQPDAIVACLIDHVRASTPEVMPKGAYPRLDALRERANTIPGVRETMAAGDETMPATPLG
ncbi:MAG TPA: glutathione S-transferase family protein [Kofleriaceae bacterium]|nr:glutathione S-transferase family protein [Kofleriaceae bacterium]